jgi:hypothetical protein
VSRCLEIPVDENEPLIRDALVELRGLISAHLPDATFAVVRREDPEGIYLRAVVDVVDLDAVVDVVLDRMVELNELGLPVYVLPEWPPARIEAHLRGTSAPVPIERLLPIG